MQGLAKNFAATIVEAMPWHLTKTHPCEVSQTQPWYSTQKDAQRDTIAKNKQKNTYLQWRGHDSNKVAKRAKPL